jgi:2-keto-4-pentenoate hydratase/2-oxohepta-3-ene-1,7-dioic acid hydratase in catechol pathway
MVIPKDPILFIKPRTALAGPGELSVSKAAQDDQLDFETELALVIGEDALDVSEEEALDYVLGSARTAFGLLTKAGLTYFVFHWPQLYRFQ